MDTKAKKTAQGNYNELHNSAEIEKMMQDELKDAKRERNMAIIGDLAGLFAQGAAMHGGAYMIGKLPNYTEQANKRILNIKMQERERKQKLNDVLLKQQQTYTKAQQQQQQFEARQNQQQQQFEARQKQQQQQFIARQNQQQQQFEARQNQPKNKRSNKTAYDVYYIYQPDNKTFKEFPNVHTAYNSLPQGYKAVKIYLDDEGRQLIIEDPHPTVAKMQQMINIYNYTKENGIEYNGFETKPFNIEKGYNEYSDKDLQTPTYNPDGTISFKKISDQPKQTRNKR